MKLISITPDRGHRAGRGVSDFCRDRLVCKEEYCQRGLGVDCGKGICRIHLNINYNI